MMRALTLCNLLACLLALRAYLAGVSGRACLLFIAAEFTVSQTAPRARLVVCGICTLVALGVAVDAGVHDDWLVSLAGKIGWALGCVRLLDGLRRRRCAH